mmetsp:Transcript_10876/g.32070  ORF Transcript_10876/g.32070 Transcript_10876/m.32070 type:complete len:100 (-) Transcript_10876:333-632(-)
MPPRCPRWPHRRVQAQRPTHTHSWTFPKTHPPPLTQVAMRTLREGYLPGDLGFDPMGLKPKGEAELLAMQNKELNNGRLAMLAIAGMTAQELVTGQQNF